MEMWLKRGIGVQVEIGDDVVESSPAFAVHRVLGVLPSGERVVKSRVAINNQHLNANTLSAPIYVGPTMEQVQLKLGRFRYYNKTDATKFFFCIPVHRDSQKFMGISYEDRLRRRRCIKLNVVMLGLCDAPKHAQQITSKAYENTECVALMDDVIGGADGVPGCCDNFVRMIGVAKEKNIMLNPSDTVCCSQEIQGIGFVFVGGVGFKPLPMTCTKALVYDISKLGDVARLRSWAGVINFLSGFIPDAASRLREMCPWAVI